MGLGSDDTDGVIGRARRLELCADALEESSGSFRAGSCPACPGTLKVLFATLRIGYGPVDPSFVVGFDAAKARSTGVTHENGGESWVWACDRCGGQVRPFDAADWNPEVVHVRAG